VPRHPRENYRLGAALRQGGHQAAWLPVRGPDWAVDGVPAYTPEKDSGGAAAAF
jgi:hypothetical protein